MGFTNATSNTFPPTTLQPLYRIWRDWCIGDSLGYMNDNFLYLETLVNNLSSSLPSPGSVINTLQTVNTGFSAITDIFPGPVNTAPVITDGREILTVTVQPKSVTSKFLIRANIYGNGNTNNTYGGGIFRSGQPTAIASCVQYPGFSYNFHLEYLDAPNTPSSVTYSVRAGTNASGGIFYLNGTFSGTQVHNGTQKTNITIQEIAG